MLCLFELIISLNLMEINYITAHTTIRLWHESHSRISKNDCANIFVPRKDLMYVSGVYFDDIKAIAACKRDITALTFSMIAIAPNNDEICDVFIKELIKKNIKPDHRMLERQPRWNFASKFYE